MVNWQYFDLSITMPTSNTMPAVFKNVCFLYNILNALICGLIQEVLYRFSSGLYVSSVNIVVCPNMKWISLYGPLVVRSKYVLMFTHSIHRRDCGKFLYRCKSIKPFRIYFFYIYTRIFHLYIIYIMCVIILYYIMRWCSFSSLIATLNPRHCLWQPTAFLRDI